MAVDIFLKIDGIPGDSTVFQHENEITIDSFAWRETQAGSAVARIAMNDIQLTAKMSKASPLLMLACVNGKPIATAVLTLQKASASPVVFEIWTFTNVIVSTYRLGYSGNLVPEDQFTLTFESIRFEYTPQTSSGGPDLTNRQAVTWNRRTNAIT
jgi:type VI secretion system secreted protein Hcp